MPKFRFAVKDEWGMRKTGVIEASNVDAARQRLLQGGFEVESVLDEGRSLELDLADGLPPASGRRLLHLSLVFVVIAVLVFLGQWMLRARPPAPPKEVRFQLVGQLDGKSADPSGARLLIDLPEIPLRLEYPWKEVATSERAFTVEVFFLSNHAPSYAWVRLSGSKVPKAIQLNATATERPDLRKIELSGPKVQVEALLWKP